MIIFSKLSCRELKNMTQIILFRTPIYVTIRRKYQLLNFESSAIRTGIEHDLLTKNGYSQNTFILLGAILIFFVFLQ